MHSLVKDLVPKNLQNLFVSYSLGFIRFVTSYTCTFSESSFLELLNTGSHIDIFARMRTFFTKSILFTLY